MTHQSIRRRSGRLTRMLLVGAIAAFGLIAGRAEAAALAGSTLAIGIKRVPLPQAAWALLSEKALEMPASSAGTSTLLDSVVAGASDNETFRYLAVVRANRAPAAGGFGLAEDCRRDDVHSARTIGRGSVIALCTFVSHVLHGASADGDPAWAAALEAAGRAGKRFPDTWLVVGVRVADGDDLLDVRYYFNPEAIGFSTSTLEPAPPPAPPGWFGRAGEKLDDLLGTAEPPHDARWLASPWSVENVAGSRSRAAIIRELEAWAEAAHRAVYTGFKGGTVEAPAPPPAWADLSSRVAAAGAGLPGEVALWKTLSWRAVGSSLDAAVSYVLTGSIGVAGSITIIGGLVNAGVYYLHEKTWEAFGSERGPGDLVTALPPAGIER
jgi:uncharacterized membrane protein